MQSQCPANMATRMLKFQVSLGFEFEETAQDDPSLDPIPGLIDRLNTGPVLLGPLDLGLLPYNPFTRGERGADHFVAAYGAENGAVYLHDPWGFPCVPLEFATLRSAWQADAISYRRGYFRSWVVLHRREWPGLDQLVDRALTLFDTIYQSAGLWLGQRLLAALLRSSVLMSWKIVHEIFLPTFRFRWRVAERWIWRSF